VRAWWKEVPERRKRDWLSARAIHRHWKAGPVDSDAPKKPSQLQRERATNQLLQQQLHELRDLLKHADGGNLFTADSSAEQIAESVGGLIRRSPSKMRAVAARLNKLAKDYEQRIKEARPAGSDKKRSKEGIQP
jgi:hypothetical protein